jgi:hypothetical protein
LSHGFFIFLAGHSGAAADFQAVEFFFAGSEKDLQGGAGGPDDKDGRGPLSADQQDLLRAALVFTSGGLDACLTRLLCDTLIPLITGHAEAEKNFKRWVSAQLGGALPGKMREAILDPIRVPRWWASTSRLCPRPASEEPMIC